MIPAVFSPYADRTPKLRRVSLRNDWAQCCTQAACGWGTSKPRGSPPRVRSMQQGVVDEEVAAPASLRTAHAARNGARVPIFSSLPSIEERRGEPSRGRETRPTVTKGVRGPFFSKTRDVNLFNFGISCDFCCGISRFSAARDDAEGQLCPRQNAPNKASSPRRTRSRKEQPKPSTATTGPWPPTARSTSSSTSTASGMLICLAGASTWSARP